MTTRCSVLLGTQASFGFGDRTGLATAGHIAAMQVAGAGIAPIFPQQSIREMARTNRTAPQVMHDAMTAVEAAGWTGLVGADADHLKTPAEIELTASAGFTFFTLDPSGLVDQRAGRDSNAEIDRKFASLGDEVAWLSLYEGKTIGLPTGALIEFDRATCRRAAVKYGRAINLAISLSQVVEAVQTAANRPYEIELSVDETDEPTTLAEHYLIAHRCLSEGVELVSLAPRFVGDFEKGVDFKGDLDELDASLADHAAIARLLGPYKLSLHSGSDKLSMYPLLARHTKQCFHVKTAGTSYLEALRVVCRHDIDLFRYLIDFARSRYEQDRATYHVSATLAGTPPQDDVADRTELEQLYLGRWDQTPAGCGFSEPGRQILHCTFGSVLTHPEYGPALRDVLVQHAETYLDVLKEHFVHHLQALRAR